MNTGRFGFVKPAAINPPVRIAKCHHYARHPCGNKRIDTRRGLSLMGTWF
jgi:hypothetical protein